MSDRTLRHLIAQYITDFLQDWYECPANAGRQPTEHDFAVWLDGRTNRSPVDTSA